MQLFLKEIEPEYYKARNMRYFFVYDKENPYVDLDQLEDKRYAIIGSVREYTDQKEYDMDIANWAFYNSNREAPNYRNKGYGKALFSLLMDEILQKKEDKELWRITIGHLFDDAVAFYTHNFKNKDEAYENNIVNRR